MINTRFAIAAAPTEGELVWSTTYTATRECLIDAGLATPTQFPEAAKARSSSNGAHPESGRWYLWQEKPLGDVWSITYYAAGFVAELSLNELRQLQRFLLNDRQITPETIGTLVSQWRDRVDNYGGNSTAGRAGAA